MIVPDKTAPVLKEPPPLMISRWQYCLAGLFRPVLRPVWKVIYRRRDKTANAIVNRIATCDSRADLESVIGKVIYAILPNQNRLDEQNVAQHIEIYKVSGCRIEIGYLSDRIVYIKGFADTTPWDAAILGPEGR